MPFNSNFNLVAQNPQTTVVSEFIPSAKSEKSYQSEADLEKVFIRQLEDQAYEYLTITNESDLVMNLRSQLEKLNSVKFSENEWKRFFENEIANPNQSIAEKTTTIQEDYKKSFIREDGSSKNIHFINKDHIHYNTLQVINQYATEEGQRSNRYDVTILVNGFPMIHIELKRRGVAIQEAFNQIRRYQRESFWSGSGLFEYIQLFVISNGTHTKYYSNTTRALHIKESATFQTKKGKQSSNSFEFTSWWADGKNNPIPDLVDFTKTFFAKHTILNILTKYCVFTSDKTLLVMRPYQIVATERIINRIETSTNSKKTGKIEAGGYIWHTTGSGKTLTSFKTALIASKLNHIEKVLFVVDRKDLDYQTMREYDKFEKESANSSTSTSILKKQLEAKDTKIIITTIQKLDRFISKNKEHGIFKGHVVLIFDECHRSQFGEMHSKITKAFNNYHLFGFTGTPIFPSNTSSSAKPDLKTTEQVFGDKLHSYTIVDAISDKNVLPFKVDYFQTFKEAENIADKKVSDIDRKRILNEPERISKIVSYIQEHFDIKTKRTEKFYKASIISNIKEVVNSKNKSEDIEKKQTVDLKGFNSIFAVSSIESAKLYYLEFKKQLSVLPSDKQLKVATIFSYGVNDEVDDVDIDENSDDTNGLIGSDRDFLDQAICDYNQMFGTSYDTSSDKFANYYKDVSLRVKNREIDILIVVNMFLTGFDAPTLNTLWVDKNLHSHGLLQAFSRTNRILNSIKTFGNIVCFRNLVNATNEAISLFGNKDARRIVLLKSFNDYYFGYTDNGKEVRGYKGLIEELLSKFSLHEQIIGEQKNKDFVQLYNTILRLRNILTTFDQFSESELLSDRDLQDYQTEYIDIHTAYRKSSNTDKENVNDDLIFEIELIKQVDINIDYILSMVAKYHESNAKDKEFLIDINKAVDSSFSLRNKKDLISQFITTLNYNSKVDDQWEKFVSKRKLDELDNIIQTENLDPEATLSLVKNAFKDGSIPTVGTQISKVLPPSSRFDPSGQRTKKRETVLTKLKDYFDRFFTISKSKF
jgi:type I restriction enzyme, R subunit